MTKPSLLADCGDRHQVTSRDFAVGDDHQVFGDGPGWAEGGKREAYRRARDPKPVEIMTGESLAALEHKHACRQCAAEVIWKLAIITGFLSLTRSVVGMVFATRVL